MLVQTGADPRTVGTGSSKTGMECHWRLTAGRGQHPGDTGHALGGKTSPARAALRALCAVSGAQHMRVSEVRESPQRTTGLSKERHGRRTQRTLLTRAFLWACERLSLGQLLAHGPLWAHSHSQGFVMVGNTTPKGHCDLDG